MQRSAINSADITAASLVHLLFVVPGLPAPQTVTSGAAPLLIKLVSLQQPP
jgi:hypothetical protein